MNQIEEFIITKKIPEKGKYYYSFKFKDCPDWYRSWFQIHAEEDRIWICPVYVKKGGKKLVDFFLKEMELIGKEILQLHELRLRHLMVPFTFKTAPNEKIIKEINNKNSI